MSSYMDELLKNSVNDEITKDFKSRKQQINNELNRIYQLLLSESVTEVSLEIHINFDKSNYNRIWKSRNNKSSELKFVEQVKKEMK